MLACLFCYQLYILSSYWCRIITSRFPWFPSVTVLVFSFLYHCPFFTFVKQFYRRLYVNPFCASSHYFLKFCLRFQELQGQFSFSKNTGCKIRGLTELNDVLLNTFSWYLKEWRVAGIYRCFYSCTNILELQLAKCSTFSTDLLVEGYRKLGVFPKDSGPCWKRRHQTFIGSSLIKSLPKGFVIVEVFSADKFSSFIGSHSHTIHILNLPTG